MDLGTTASLGLTYDDYTAAIKTLLLTIQHSDRTIVLVTTVLNQAKFPGKSARWMEQELTVEGMIHGIDRADFLRLELEQADTINNG